MQCYLQSTTRNGENKISPLTIIAMTALTGDCFFTIAITPNTIITGVHTISPNWANNPIIDPHPGVIKVKYSRHNACNPAKYSALVPRDCFMGYFALRDSF